MRGRQGGQDSSTAVCAQAHPSAGSCLGSLMLWLSESTLCRSLESSEACLALTLFAESPVYVGAPLLRLLLRLTLAKKHPRGEPREWQRCPSQALRLLVGSAVAWRSPICIFCSLWRCQLSSQPPLVHTLSRERTNDWKGENNRALQKTTMESRYLLGVFFHMSTLPKMGLEMRAFYR